RTAAAGITASTPRARPLPLATWPLDARGDPGHTRRAVFLREREWAPGCRLGGSQRVPRSRAKRGGDYVSSRVAPRRHAAKLLSAVLPLAAILALSMVSGAGAASSSAPATFKATPAPTGSVDGFTPAVSPISKSISTVIVQLSGDPVT